MSLISAYRAYSSLTGEQKSILKEKTIDGSRTVAEWIALLGGVARYDGAADPLRQGVGCLSAIGFLLAFIAGVATGSFVLFIVVVVATVPFLILYGSLRRSDISNLLREFVLPLLALMREDMSAEAPLHLKLDLGKGMTDAKRTDQKPLPGPRTIVQSSYRNGWMEGDGTLTDGSTLAWSIVDLIRERKVTRRNPRGKTKTKVKYKVRRMIDMRIGLRRDDYLLAGTAPKGGGNERIDVKSGEKRNVLRVRRVVESADPDAILDLDDFIGPLAAAYRRVALNNAEEK